MNEASTILSSHRTAGACLLLLLGTAARAQPTPISTMFSPPLNAGYRQTCTVINTSSQPVTISAFRIVRVDGGTVSEPASSSSCGQASAVLAPGESCKRISEVGGGWGHWLGISYCRVRHTGSETALVGNFMTDGGTSTLYPWTMGTVPLQRVTIPVAP